MSSVKVAQGWRAVIYRDTDYRGQALEVTADAPNLQLVAGTCSHDGLNDCITSIKVIAPGHAFTSSACSAALQPGRSKSRGTA